MGANAQPLAGRAASDRPRAWLSDRDADRLGQDARRGSPRLQALSGFMLSLSHRMFDGPWLNTQLGDHHERSLLAATSQKGGFAHSQPFAVHKALKGLFMVGLERQSEA